MREEPVIYINGRPFVLREDERPFKNMQEYTGIDVRRLEQMELRLKNDILQVWAAPLIKSHAMSCVVQCQVSCSVDWSCNVMCHAKLPPLQCHSRALYNPTMHPHTFLLPLFS